MTGSGGGGRLVIGIGNPLRGDDGVGALLAEQAAVLSALEPGGPVVVRGVQQLLPELAAELAQLEAVLFIDAWLAPPGAMPRLDPLVPGPGDPCGGIASHRLEPAQLLAITETLYGRAPHGSWLRVPARLLEHGTGFSPELKAALPAARELLRHWLAAEAGGGRTDA